MHKRYPLLLPALAFITGITIAGFLSPNRETILIIAGLAGLLFGSMFFAKYRSFSLYMVLFIALGFLLTGAQNEYFETNHYTRIANKNGLFKGQLTQIAVPTQRAIRLAVELTEQAGEKPKAISGTVFLYVPKSAAYDTLITGQTVLFQAHFKTINPPKNPHEFDYRNYVHLHQIYWQAYTDRLKVLPPSGRLVTGTRDKLRQFFLRTIGDMQLSDEQRAVASALLLGYRFYLTSETEQAFAGAGAMHVLAVSGLHVGILYLITAFILKLDKKKRHRNHWLKVLLVVCIIWSYAFLTGLSPSVNRAAIMFTFVSLGGLFKRNPSTYQAILSSAVVLLVYNPNNLFEVGFQLSYAAVLGILIIQPKLYHLLQFRYKLADVIWSISTVSIAAQLATFPLSVYYFHQFPTFFIVSNLFVIPLAYGIMLYGILLMFISLIVAVPAFLVLPFKAMLYIMTTGVHAVESLPYAVLGGLSISRLELVILTITVYSIALALWQKQKRSLFLSAVLILTLAILNTIEKNEQRQAQNLTFYSINKQVAIGVQHGQTGLLVADSGLLLNESKMLFHIRHHQWATGIPYQEYALESTVDENILTIQESVIDIMDKRIAVLKDQSDTALLTLEPDYLVIRGNLFPPKDLPKPDLQVILTPQLNPAIQQAWQAVTPTADLTPGYYQVNLND